MEETKTAEELLADIKSKDEEIQRLRNALNHRPWLERPTILNKEDISRYSRQMLLPGFGIAGQEALKAASVLIVGAGGLGCPCAAYLAAAGIGKIGVVDFDSVESSNLHRQILHSEAKLGMSKVDSLILSLRQLNSRPEYVGYNVLFDSSNAQQIVENYQVVVDATDNVGTRYLVNEVCARLQRPLVSGSALRWEGQLCVYNYKGGPCYRCLFPSPPPKGAVASCSDEGVLGMVPGIIGCFQALEVVKVLTGSGDVCSRHLLLLDGSGGVVRRVSLRGKVPDCPTCGPSASRSSLAQNYGAVFCTALDKIPKLDDGDRISCEDLKRRLDEGSNFLLLDVRPAEHYALCHLPRSVNIPIDSLDQKLPDVEEKLTETPVSEAIVLCRRGNDSQLAVHKLRQWLEGRKGPSCSIYDVRGGLEAWARTIDPGFPTY